MIFTFRNALLLVILLALAGATQADYHDVVFCGELAESDCALLKVSHENAAQKISGTADLNLDLFWSVPELEPFKPGFALEVQVIWNSDLRDVEMLDLTTIYTWEDDEELLTMIADVLSRTSTWITVSLNLPPEMQGFVEEEIPEAYFSGADLLEVRLLEGDVYLDLSGLASLAPNEIPRGWFGFNVMDVLKAAQARNVLPAENESDLGTIAAREESLANLEEMVAFWTDPAFLETFVAIERLPDEMITGQTAAVFKTRLDLPAMFLSDRLREVLMASADAAEGIDIEGNDVSGTVTLMAGMLEWAAILVAGIDIEALHILDVKEEVPLRQEVHLAWDLSALEATLGSLTGAQETDSEAGPESDSQTDVSLDTVTVYSYPDEEVPIPVPENAFFLPPGLIQVAQDALGRQDFADPDAA
ncbi:MAG: hypothetical protein OXF63_04275 [Anaerolineaceae bacterium]|nr:hypothetical protein [Anaerolineaceae bacterium]